MPNRAWRRGGTTDVKNACMCHFSLLFDRLPVRILTSDLHHRTIRKRASSCSLRPAGSDPEVVCQKNSFLKISVSLGGFGPSVAHGNILWDDVVFKLRKTRQKLALSLTPLGAVRAAAEGTGYKNRRLGKSRGVRFDARLVQSVRCDTLWAWKGSLSLPALTSECLWEHSRCLSSACIVVGAVTVTPAENFVSLLSESSGLLRISIKKKKKKSQCRRTTVSSSKRTFANPSKFLWTLRSTDWKWTAVDCWRGITAAEGHGASKSTGWPRQRWTKSPKAQTAGWVKRNHKKNRSLFLHVLVQSSYILDVVGTFWFWSSTNMPRDHCWARHFDFVRSCHLRDLLTITDATSQRHDLLQWCNGKAIEALAGRRPTARWRCLRNLISVRLPLLP